MSKNNKPLSTRKWKNQRALVFRTKGRECYICGEWADAVDHVISRKRGGSDDLANLEPICKQCNSRKGSKEYGVFLGRTSTDRKSTRLNSSHIPLSRMPSSA